MSDIEQWLAQFGLGQYACAFIDNDIDREVLPDLSDVDLKELGVSLGHRKKLLKAIAALPATETSGPAQVSPGASLDNDDDLTVWSRTPGERKPVTMLFADIVGSTALTERLDAEDTHELLYGATRQMCDAVEANGGTVCRFMGDGVMAMFGAPIASERHALEACQAGLDMQERIVSQLLRGARSQRRGRYSGSCRIAFRRGRRSGGGRRSR